MKVINETKLLVLVGAWNRRIFLNEWIEKYLLPDESFEIEVSLKDSHRVSTDQFRIEFHEDKLNFIPREFNLGIFDRISDLANKIADYLPHTPVLAYGVNFLFECRKEDIQSELIVNNDVDRLNEHGVQVVESQHKHRIRGAQFKNSHLNLSFVSAPDKLFLEFNYHSDIKSLIEFKDKIAEFSIDQLYNTSKDIMVSVYKAEVDDCLGG